MTCLTENNFINLKLCFVLIWWTERLKKTALYLTKLSMTLQFIMCFQVHHHYYYFKLFHLFIFLERGERREKERERNKCGRSIDWLPLACPQLGAVPPPKHAPWLELNRRPFSPQAGAQSTKLHQPELKFIISFDFPCRLYFINGKAEASGSWVAFQRSHKQ